MSIHRSQIIRFDLTRSRHTGGTKRGLDWAGGQFLSLRGDLCGIFHFSRGMVKCYSVELISNYIEKVVFESH